MIDSDPYSVTIQNGPVNGSKLYIWGQGRDRMMAEFYPVNDYWSFTFGWFPEGTSYPPINYIPYQPTGQGNASRHLATAINAVLDFVDTLSGERTIRVELFKDTSASRLMPRLLERYSNQHGYEVVEQKGVNTDTYLLKTGDDRWVR